MSDQKLTGSCHCGAPGWTLGGDPGGITACNCTLCRRYGTLWAYDYENERITVTGLTRAYTRRGKDNPSLEIPSVRTAAASRIGAARKWIETADAGSPSTSGWRRPTTSQIYRSTISTA